MLKDSKQKNLSDIINNYLSGHIRDEDDYKMFVNFVEAFYEWLEYQDETKRITNNRPSIKDLDYALDEFVDYWHRLVAEHLPTILQVDRRFLLKHMKEVYQAKGTEKSYKLLFRMIFNDTITLRYPGESILIPSSAIWREIIQIDVKDDGKSIFETEFTVMTGLTSGATGVIEKVQRVTTGGQRVFRVDYSVESKDGDFVVGEDIKFSNDAQLEVISVSNPEGQFLGEKGRLNTTAATLQDSNFYQLYSYVIDAPVAEPDVENEVIAALNLDLWSWLDVVRNVLHPAGMKLFGSLRIENSIQLFGTEGLTSYTFINLLLELVSSMAKKNGESLAGYKFVNLLTEVSSKHYELDSNENRVGSQRIGLPEDHLESNNDRWIPFGGGIKDNNKVTTPYLEMPILDETDPIDLNGDNYRKNSFHAVHSMLVFDYGEITGVIRKSEDFGSITTTFDSARDYLNLTQQPRSTPEEHVKLYVPNLDDILAGTHSSKRLKLNLDTRIYKRQMLTIYDYNLVSGSISSNEDFGLITNTVDTEMDYLTLNLKEKTKSNGIVYYES